MPEKEFCNRISNGFRGLPRGMQHSIVLTLYERTSMDGLLLGLLVWLQIKHFVADYLLQTPWMIAGKGHFDKPGGYVHAGIHIAGTAPALFYSGIGTGLVALLLLAEFLIHFTVDHLKALQGRAKPQSLSSARFWAAHGADQLAHHLTYSGILFVVMQATAR